MWMILHWLWGLPIGSRLRQTAVFSHSKIQTLRKEAKAADLHGRLTTLTDQMNAYAKDTQAGHVEMKRVTAEALNEVGRGFRETQDWAAGFQARLKSGGLQAGGGLGAARAPDRRAKALVL